MQKTSIPWADRSWNPTSGCNGPNGVRCPYCYMARMNHRFGRSFAPTAHPEKLNEPLKLKRPSRIFVDSAGDLFDPAIPDEFIGQVFRIIALCSVCRPQMTFLVLTKQAGRMSDFVRDWSLSEPEWQPEYPLPNLWLGVTAENQAAADQRIPLLLNTPAAVRFVSIEPMLGPVDLSEVNYSNQLREVMRDATRFWNKTYPERKHQDPDEAAAEVSGDAVLNILTGEWFDGWDGGDDGKKIDWVIIGNDSRPGQPMPDPAWVQAIIDQCRAAEVPIFVKGRLAEQWPIQEWPKGVQR